MKKICKYMRSKCSINLDFVIPLSIALTQHLTWIFEIHLTLQIFCNISHNKHALLEKEKKQKLIMNETTILISQNHINKCFKICLTPT